MSVRGTAIFLLLLPSTLLVFLCTQQRRQNERDLTQERGEFARPDFVPYPASNPYRASRAALGKKLFFDKRLSLDGSLSCASCHSPARSWGDGLPRGRGFHGKVLKRKVPTLLNLAWEWSFFWDGREKTLESQALRPVESKDEMNLPLPVLRARLQAIPEYAKAFSSEFGGEGVTEPNIARALASFEREIVSDISAFDRWIGGEEDALSESAQHGFQLFNEKAECVRCHSGWRFTNGSYADTGLRSEDRGRGAITGSRVLEHAFKTPTLRDIARRAPYMHDGSITTLRAVIDFYDRGGDVGQRGVVQFIRPLNLSETEKGDLLSFLESLNEANHITQEALCQH